MKISFLQSLAKWITTSLCLLLLSFLFGLIMTFIFTPSSFKASGHGNAFPYILMGSLLGTFAFSIINVLYLLPLSNLKIKFLSPGMISVLLFITAVFSTDDKPTTVFFLGCAFINLSLGYYHYKKVTKHSSAE